ncbi:MAG: hypothetical protein JXR84_13095 [Anaerolineae bacterium]|nr:hypothetical protein [Anaerolineae bacterium]
MEISVVILTHEDMRLAVGRYLSEVLNGQVQVNSIKTLKGQRGFSIDLAIFEPVNLDVDAAMTLPPQGNSETNPFASEDAHPGHENHHPIAKEG